MPKEKVKATDNQTESNECKNLISHSLAILRRKRGFSQRELAYQLQLAGLDVDKNVITRIETNKRLVRDIELQVICEVLGTTCDELLNSSTHDSM